MIQKKKNFVEESDFIFNMILRKNGGTIAFDKVEGKSIQNGKKYFVTFEKNITYILKGKDLKIYPNNQLEGFNVIFVKAENALELQKNLTKIQKYNMKILKYKYQIITNYLQCKASGFDEIYENKICDLTDTTLGESDIDSRLIDLFGKHPIKDRPSEGDTLPTDNTRKYIITELVKLNKTDFDINANLSSYSGVEKQNSDVQYTWQEILDIL